MKSRRHLGIIEIALAIMVSIRNRRVERRQKAKLKRETPHSTRSVQSEVSLSQAVSVSELDDLGGLQHPRLSSGETEVVICGRGSPLDLPLTIKLQ